MKALNSNEVTGRTETGSLGPHEASRQEHWCALDGACIEPGNAGPLSDAPHTTDSTVTTNTCHDILVCVYVCRECSVFFLE